MDKIIIANWKSNPKTLKEAQNIFNGSLNLSKNIKNKKIIVCPPFLFSFLGKNLKLKNILLGAQSVFPSVSNSYTGEVFVEMLKDMNVSYVIVGHSERRSLGESDEYINNQIKTVLKNKLNIVFCIGEKNRDQNADFLSFIKNQIIEGLKNVTRNQLKNIVVAYEPVWAIGKDAIREATDEEFIEIKIYIRKILSDLFGPKSASSVRVIYGGSVNSNNAKKLIDAGADGLLVGRDSLDIKKFEAILKSF